MADKMERDPLYQHGWTDGYGEGIHDVLSQVAEALHIIDAFLRDIEILKLVDGDRVRDVMRDVRGVLRG